MEKRYRQEVWRDEVIEWVFDSWREALGGRMPETIWCWKRVLRRVGVTRWRILPGCVLPEPYVRRYVLYLPRVHCYDVRLARYLAHETAEATLCWSGIPPYLYVSDRCERHRIACEIEDRCIAEWWELESCSYELTADFDK